MLRFGLLAIGWMAGLCAVAVLAAEGPAQPPPGVRVGADAPAKPNPPAFLLKTDPDLDALMEQAAQLVTSGQLNGAIEIYQGIVEKAEDRVVAVAAEARAGESPRVFLPAADAVRRALLEGPEPLRKTYIARFEPEATRSVETASVAGDVTELRRIAGRYPVTVAAQRARRCCAAWLADQGDFASASTAWEEFLSFHPVLGGAGEDLALALVQWTQTLARSGQVGHARAALGRLEKEFAGAKRVIGGRPQGVVEVARQMVEAQKVQAGDAALPAAFAPTPRWRARTAGELSPFICVSGRQMFIRSLATMASLEMTTGKRLWETPAPMLNGPELGAMRQQMPGSSLEREVVCQQGFAVAATPDLVCSVENASLGGGSPEMRGLVVFGGPAAPAQQGGKFAGSSELVARHARTGKRLWCVGRGEGRDEFVRVLRWVSPPVVAGRRVFVIALQVQSYHLVCLDAADGRLVWHSLISHRTERNPGWQAGADLPSASPPCIANGRVVCLTNGGVVAAFDQFTGAPAWFCQYTAPTVAGAMAMTPQRVMSVNPVLVREQTAVVLPADAGQVMAFDIGTGRLQWQQSRKEQRFLAGIAAKEGTNLVLLTGTTAAALSLSTGEPVWERLFDTTAGRPVVRGRVLYAPSLSRGVVQLDALSGREICSSAAGADFRHLAVSDTALVVLGRRMVATLRSLSEALDESTQRVTASPSDASAWRDRGELNLQAARYADAFKDLSKASELEPKTAGNLAAIHTLLFRCCLELAVHDPVQSKSWLDRAAGFALTGAMRSERWLRVADWFETQKNWPGAADALQQILDHEAETWLDVLKCNQEAGGGLAGGRVSNRALAAQRLEQLVEVHGRSVISRGEALAKRQLAEATKHRDVRALQEILAQHPVGETQERAWLALATQHYEMRRWDAAADVLVQFLRAEPQAAHRGDAALGAALSGIQAGRGGLVRMAIACLEPLSAQARVSFAGVTGRVSEKRAWLSRETLQAAPSATGAQENPNVANGGLEIRLLQPSDASGIGKLLLDDRHFVRLGTNGTHVLWTSASVVEKRNNASSMSAAILTDSVVVFAGNQLVALDGDTGKLLWMERGVKLGGSTQGAAAEWVVWNGRGPGVGRVLSSGRITATGLRTWFLQGEPLLRVDATGWLMSPSPRTGKPVWSVRLTEPFNIWGNASVQVSGRYIVLTAATVERAAESLSNAPMIFGPAPFTTVADSPGDFRVAVLDAWRGRLLAVWSVPKEWQEFSVGPDGRVRLVERADPKKDKPR